MREEIDFDVIVIGAGPAGLSVACKLAQLAKSSNIDISICVIDKGKSIGSHIISGAIMEVAALNELFPDWKEKGAPVHTLVSKEIFYFLPDECRHLSLPLCLTPKIMHNQGNYIVSLGAFCQWLSQQAEQLNVTVLPAVSAVDFIYHVDGSVAGVLTGDMGVGKNHDKKQNYVPGIVLHAKQTILAEGSRGNLSGIVFERYNLCKNADAQHYSIGFKELWNIRPDKYIPGLVMHGLGWPLMNKASGGFFLYHGERNQLSLGMSIDLNYSNPELNPYEEFQMLKEHSLIKDFLIDAEIEGYGARTITKGGFNSLPEMSFPGGMIIGCDAGTLNPVKLKGIHTAMRSGIIAAEHIIKFFSENTNSISKVFDLKANNSYLYDELYESRNFAPILHKYSFFFSCIFAYIDQVIFSGKTPVTLHDNHADHTYFDEGAIPVIYSNSNRESCLEKNASLFFSNIVHNDDQPNHLKLPHQETINFSCRTNVATQLRALCPAGVYEVADDNRGKKLIVNSQNCLHCKSCDVKERYQKLIWCPPEAGSGPNYINM
ncbi:electron transfer flavoprotein-ubiquinone oxidoreductase [Brenneria goodwinii]|uniref:electron transfer flavoprotein-ubiquinone oxidoreductase n=1 Tax=Brenneria goodwinii TaxID=1109412 RepID=UPI0036F2E126